MAFTPEQEAILKAIADNPGTPIDGKANLALGNVTGAERLPVSAGTDTGGIGPGATDRKITFTTFKNWLLSFFAPKKTTVYVTPSTIPNPILPDINYLVISTAGEVNITMPLVASGDDFTYYFTLKSNGKHCNLLTTGGQLIGDKSQLSISTVNSCVVIRANKIDGYDIISDGREYLRVNHETSDLNLDTGIESNGRYEFSVTNGQTLTVTVQDWSAIHKGDHAVFYKLSGVNSIVRVVSEDETFDEEIFINGASFELVYGELGFEIGQDSRPKVQTSSITLFALTEASGVSTYNKAVLNTSDPEFSTTPTDFDVGLITGAAQFVAAFITVEGAIQGTINETNIISFSRWRKAAGSGSGTAQAYAEVYKRETGGTETLLATTSKTPIITESTYIEFTVTGLLPTETFLSTDRVLVKVYMDRIAGGSDPTYELEVEGLNPARLSFSVPSSTQSHDTLPGVNDAGVGVDKGHVDSDLYKEIVPFQTNYTSSATPTPTGDFGVNELYITALAVDSELQIPDNTPANGNELFARIKDNGVARLLTYNAIYTGDLPSTTVPGQTLYLELKYNSTTSKWESQNKLAGVGVFYGFLNNVAQIIAGLKTFTSGIIINKGVGLAYNEFRSAATISLLDFKDNTGAVRFEIRDNNGILEINAGTNANKSISFSANGAIIKILKTPAADATFNETLTYNPSTGAIELRESEYTALTPGASVAYDLLTGLNKTLNVAVDTTITFSNPINGMPTGDIRLNVTVADKDIILAGAGVTFTGYGSLTGLPIGVYHIYFDVISATQIDYTITPIIEVVQLSCSDLLSDLATGTTKAYFRTPYAMTVTEVRASVLTAPTDANLIIDINESGTTILSTKLSIDAGEKTSETATTPPVISDATLADDAEITIDIDQIGSTIAGAGLIVTLKGYKT